MLFSYFFLYFESKMKLLIKIDTRRDAQAAMTSSHSVSVAITMFTFYLFA